MVVYPRHRYPTERPDIYWIEGPNICWGRPSIYRDLKNSVLPALKKEREAGGGAFFVVRELR
jgi:hypothetical protein